MLCCYCSISYFTYSNAPKRLKLQSFPNFEETERMLTVNDATILQNNIKIIITAAVDEIKKHSTNIACKQSILNVGVTKEIDQKINFISAKTLSQGNVMESMFPLKTFDELQQFCESLKMRDFKNIKVNC